MLASVHLLLTEQQQHQPEQQEQFTMLLKLLVISVLFTALVLANTTEESSTSQQPTSDRSDFKKSLSKDCAVTYSITCLKLDVVSWVDKLNEDDNYSVLPGVTVVREENSGGRSNNADIVAELARDFPNNPDARLDAYLLKKVESYINTHSIKLNLWDAANTDIASARKSGGGGGGGGGGGKKGGGLGYILAAGAMMKGTLMAIGMGALAALAGKALMTALISLMLSAIIGLKSLTHQGKSTTYEVISKPIYTHANTHSASHEEHGGHYGHSSYGRSFDVPLPLGLQPGYNPAQ